MVADYGITLRTLYTLPTSISISWRSDMGICMYTCRYHVWLLVLIKVDKNINSSQITEYTETVYASKDDDDIILQPSSTKFLTPVSLHVCRWMFSYAK